MSLWPGEPLPEAEILLIGTVHRAPELEAPLRELLLASRPGVISVEISPFSLRLRRRLERRWLLRLERLAAEAGLSGFRAVAQLREALRLPYELRAAGEVARRLGLPLVPVDASAPARRHLRDLLGLLRRGALVALARGEPPSAARELALARLHLTAGVRPPVDEEDEAREDLMARRLRRLIAHRGPLRHVGGWRHLPGLLSRLPGARGVLLLGAPG